MHLGLWLAGQLTLVCILRHRFSPPRWLRLVASVGLVACAQESHVDRPLGGGGVEVTDAVGRTHVFAGPPSRIVSLVPAASSVVLVLGGAEYLVGRTDFDTAQAVAHLPSVGGGLNPSLEALIALDPDLVIRFAGETDITTPKRLDDLGIPHFAVRPESILDIRQMMTDLGLITDRSDEAASLLASIDRLMTGIREKVAGLPRLRAAFLMAGNPPWVAGSTTYVGELIELAGGENVFGDVESPWSVVSPETLVAREMDVLLLTEGAVLDPRLSSNVPTTRYVSADILLPGPTLGDAAVEIARALRPGLFR